MLDLNLRVLERNFEVVYAVAFLVFFVCLFLSKTIYESKEILLWLRSGLGMINFMNLALRVQFLYQMRQYNYKDRRGQRDLNVLALEENSEITESPCG